MKLQFFSKTSKGLGKNIQTFYSNVDSENYQCLPVFSALIFASWCSLNWSAARCRKIFSTKASIFFLQIESITQDQSNENLTAVFIQAHQYFFREVQRDPYLCLSTCPFHACALIFRVFFSFAQECQYRGSVPLPGRIHLSHCMPLCKQATQACLTTFSYIICLFSASRKLFQCFSCSNCKTLEESRI